MRHYVIMLFGYLVIWLFMSMFDNLPVCVTIYRPWYGYENYSARDACWDDLSDYGACQGALTCKISRLFHENRQ